MDKLVVDKFCELLNLCSEEERRSIVATILLSNPETKDKPAAFMVVDSSMSRLDGVTTCIVQSLMESSPQDGLIWSLQTALMLLSTSGATLQQMRDCDSAQKYSKGISEGLEVLDKALGHLSQVEIKQQPS